jgi:predicted ATPase
MLTMIKIENFRGFGRFTLRLGPKQLIMGPSGSGKTTVFEVLGMLRDFIIRGFAADDVFKLENRTRWLESKTQTFELETTFNGSKSWYRLIIELSGPTGRSHVAEELLEQDGKILLLFDKGNVRLAGKKSVTYDLDSQRSALATLSPKHETKALAAFKAWLEGVYCLRPNPRVMTARSEKEDAYLESDGSNFASSYRHQVQEDTTGTAALQAALKEVIEQFVSLDAAKAGQNVRVLTARMRRSLQRKNSRSEFDLSFSELSDGERQLVFLYFVATCIVPYASLVLIDEADNYLPLSEIQPWLNAIEESVDKRRVQLLLISHHPELLNQWATAYGLRFDRNDKGEVTAERFCPQNTNGALTASELVARGWDNE